MTNILKEQVAIITGGGRGIGKAFALRFAEEGAKLVIPDINLANAEKVAEEIRFKGSEAIALEVDISSENATMMMAQEVNRKYGKVDILINNAAIYYGIQSKEWNAWGVEEWDRMFEVNVKGTWLCCKAIAPLMVKQSKGKIINISSAIIRKSSAAWLLPYALSKAAVYTMTQALARALGPSGINVNSIGPGYTATEASMSVPDYDIYVKENIKMQCIPRQEQVSDLVGTAVFLASKESDFLTGQFILVDGGSVMV